MYSANLTIDLGNSQTRYIIKTADMVSDVQTLSNEFAVISDDYSPSETYQNNDNIIFKNEEGNWVANGPLAQREFPKFLLRPSALDSKYSSVNTFLSLRLIFIDAAKTLANMLNIPMDTLEVAWDITLLAPPLQRTNPKFEEITRNIETVEVVFPRAYSVDVKINKFKVVPEGLAGFFAATFQENRALRPSSVELGVPNANILILDIGAGTTDVSVISEMKAIEDAFDTFSTGGNQIHERLGKVLRSEGYRYPSERVKEAAVTGTIKDGLQEVDLTDKIVSIKRSLAQNLRNEIRQAFESSSVEARSIDFLFVIGGGSIETSTSALSDYILEYIREISPNIGKLNPPTDIDIRHLNVKGASIIS